MIAAFLVANLVAALIVVAFPNLKRSPSDSISRAHHELRQAFARQGRALLDWYGAKSIEEVTALWTEFAARPVRYAPYVQWEMTPYEGKYFAISENGYRRSK